MTKRRSPQTTGLECASPGIGVRHNTFSPVFGSQRSGRFCPSATPDAFGPLKDGQLPFASAGRGSAGGRSGPERTIFRSGIGSASPSGRHVLALRIMRRGTQSSLTAVRAKCVRSMWNRYWPASAHGLPAVVMTRRSPSLVHVPVNVGQPWPLSVNTPSDASLIEKAPYLSTDVGGAGACWARIEPMAIVTVATSETALPAIQTAIVRRMLPRVKRPGGCQFRT